MRSIIITKNRSRGVTFVELLISVSMFTLIGAAVAWLVLATARVSRDSLDFVRTEDQARVVVDTLRSYMILGEFDPDPSAQVVISNREVQFRNSNSSDVWQIVFDGSKLDINNMTTGQTIRSFPNVEDATFSNPNTLFIGMTDPAIVQFTVTVAASDWRGNGRPITLTDEVFLRNMPV